MSDEEIRVGKVVYFQRRFDGFGICERCDTPFEIWSETDFLEIDSEGNRRHVSYGSPRGECCGGVYGEDSVMDVIEILSHFSKQESES